MGVPSAIGVEGDGVDGTEMALHAAEKVLEHLPKSAARDDGESIGAVHGKTRKKTAPVTLQVNGGLSTSHFAPKPHCPERVPHPLKESGPQQRHSEPFTRRLDRPWLCGRPKFPNHSTAERDCRIVRAAWWSATAKLPELRPFNTQTGFTQNWVLQGL